MRSFERTNANDQTNESRTEVFVGRNTRESPTGEQTRRFIFTHGRPALRVIFSLSGKNATFARERHDFSFPTSTVKLTSKSLRTAEGPSFSTPRESRSAGTRAMYRVFHALLILPELSDFAANLESKFSRRVIRHDLFSRFPTSSK